MKSFKHIARHICPRRRVTYYGLYSGSLQVATKAGKLNVPEWYEAGSVWVKNNPGFPFGRRPQYSMS